MHEEFTVTKRSSASGMRTVTCSLDAGAAGILIRKLAKARKLTAQGFRRGKAPAHLLYRENKPLLDSLLTAELRRHPPRELEAKLKRAGTPPEYDVLPWDGKGGLHIQVSAYLTPAAPVPGARHGAQANPGPASGDISPQAGIQHGAAGEIPEGAAQQLGARGIQLGASVLGQKPPGIGLGWEQRVSALESTAMAGPEPVVGAAHDPAELLAGSTGIRSATAPEPIVEPASEPAPPELHLGATSVFGDGAGQTYAGAGTSCAENAGESKEEV
jgi:hypothetical protein